MISQLEMSALDERLLKLESRLPSEDAFQERIRSMERMVPGPDITATDVRAREAEMFGGVSGNEVRTALEAVHGFQETYSKSDYAEMRAALEQFLANRR